MSAAGLPAAARRVPRLHGSSATTARSTAGSDRSTRMVPEETAVAFTFAGATWAVMMATPADLEDFAVGFCLTEGIVDHAAEIEAIEVAVVPEGVDLRLWLAPDRAARAEARRRRRAGPVGCGLCGLESLAEAARSLPRVQSRVAVTASDIEEAGAALARGQILHQETHAVHAAAFWQRGPGLRALREDVGRHCALDKLVGALARDGIDPGSGLVVLTSRISVEIVQKAAMVGIGVLAAVSAPTAFAIRQAEDAGITLIGILRADGFDVFTHADRIAMTGGHPGATVIHVA